MNERVIFLVFDDKNRGVQLSCQVNKSMTYEGF